MCEASQSALMEKERKVSVKLEAKDEVPLLPMTRGSGYAAMKSEETVCVKSEATNEILNVSDTKIAELVQPACQLCSRTTGCDVTDIFTLETKVSDIGADALVPIVRIKKEPDDTSDEKIVTNLLGVCKFCDHAKGGGGEEEKEMIAGLITEADKARSQKGSGAQCSPQQETLEVLIGEHSALSQTSAPAPSAPPAPSAAVGPQTPPPLETYSRRRSRKRSADSYVSAVEVIAQKICATQQQQQQPPPPVAACVLDNFATYIGSFLKDIECPLLKLQLMHKMHQLMILTKMKDLQQE